MLIAICNKNEEVQFTYESQVVPRKGELKYKNYIR